MENKLQDFTSDNIDKSLNFINRLLDNTFLKGDSLKESVQEQIDMHLIIAGELSNKMQQEINELKEYIVKKTARITVLDNCLKQLSDSSLNLGSIKESLKNDNIEDDKAK